MFEVKEPQVCGVDVTDIGVKRLYKGTKIEERPLGNTFSIECPKMMLLNVVGLRRVQVPEPGT